MQLENTAGITRRCSLSLMAWQCASYHGVRELIIVESTMRNTNYMDNQDHNLLGSIENILVDAKIAFIFHHKKAPTPTACIVVTCLGEHGGQMIQ